MLQTEKFILSLTITLKQIENKTLLLSARQQQKKKQFLNSPSWFLTRDEAATKETTPTGTLTNPRRNIETCGW